MFFSCFFWSSCSCRRPFFFPILLLLLILLMLLIILVLLLMLLQLPMIFLLLHVLLLFIYRALFSQFLQQSYNPLTLPPLLIPVFPMICQWSAHALPGLHACGQLPVSQRVVAFIRQTDWTDLCASHWTDHGFGRPRRRPFDRQLARPLDRPNTGRRVGRRVGRADHWACFCVANKQANVSSSQSSNGFYGFASSLLQGPSLAFIGQT